MRFYRESGEWGSYLWYLNLAIELRYVAWFCWLKHSWIVKWNYLFTSVCPLASLLPFIINFSYTPTVFIFVWSNWLDFSVSTAHDVSLCFRSYYVYGPSPYFNTLFATQTEINIIWLNWALIIMLYSFFLWLFCSSVLF